MTASSNPGPDDNDALSAWERQALERIEDDLTASDPRLAHRFRRRGPRTARWWPLSLRSTALLFVALLFLVVAGALLPSSWWAFLGLITTLVIIPWILLAAVERQRTD
jgi:Flp pilus assembly protein TadB